MTAVTVTQRDYLKLLLEQDELNQRLYYLDDMKAIMITCTMLYVALNGRHTTQTLPKQLMPFILYMIMNNLHKR